MTEALRKCIECGRDFMIHPTATGRICLLCWNASHADEIQTLRATGGLLDPLTGTTIRQALAAPEEGESHE